MRRRPAPNQFGFGFGFAGAFGALVPAQSRR